MNKGELNKIKAILKEIEWIEERIHNAKWWQYFKRRKLMEEIWYWRGKEIGFREGINYKSNCNR